MTNVEAPRAANFESPYAADLMVLFEQAKGLFTEDAARPEVLENQTADHHSFGIRRRTFVTDIDRRRKAWFDNQLSRAASEVLACNPDPSKVPTISVPGVSYWQDVSAAAVRSKPDGSLTFKGDEARADLGERSTKADRFFNDKETAQLEIFSLATNPHHQRTEKVWPKGGLYTVGDRTVQVIVVPLPDESGLNEEPIRPKRKTPQEVPEIRYSTGTPREVMINIRAPKTVVNGEVLDASDPRAVEALTLPNETVVHTDELALEAWLANADSLDENQPHPWKMGDAHRSIPKSAHRIAEISRVRKIIDTERIAHEVYPGKEVAQTTEVETPAPRTRLRDRLRIRRDKARQPETAVEAVEELPTDTTAKDLERIFQTGGPAQFTYTDVAADYPVAEVPAAKPARTIGANALFGGQPRETEAVDDSELSADQHEAVVGLKAVLSGQRPVEEADSNALPKRSRQVRPTSDEVDEDRAQTLASLRARFGPKPEKGTVASEEK